jgi:hypothetical protein
MRLDKVPSKTANNEKKDVLQFRAAVSRQRQEIFVEATLPRPTVISAQLLVQ